MESRLEIRIAEDSKHRLMDAASLAGEPVSEFVRHAVMDRTEEVLRDQHETVLPSEFFDELLAALDAPPKPSPALRRAARRARDVVRWV